MSRWNDWPQEERERDAIQERIIRRGRRASHHMGLDVRRDVERLRARLEKTLHLPTKTK